MTNRDTHSDNDHSYAVAWSVIAILWIIALAIAMWVKAGSV